MPIVGTERNDEFYVNTTVVIPLRLRKEAKKRGISISCVCTAALAKEIGEEHNE